MRKSVNRIVALTIAVIVSLTSVPLNVKADTNIDVLSKVAEQTEYEKETSTTVIETSAIEEHQITVDAEHGSVVFGENKIPYDETKEVAYEADQEVKVYIEPDEGFNVQEVTASYTEKEVSHDLKVKADETEQDLYVFDMPNGDVALQVTFQEAESESEIMPNTEKSTDANVSPERQDTALTDEETETETNKDTVNSNSDFTPDVYDVYMDGTSRMARAASYKVVTVDPYNYLFPETITSGGSPVFAPGTQTRYLQYNGSDTFVDGMVKKAAYCMASVLEDPAGNVTSTTSLKINKRLNYILYNGVRRLGKQAYNEAYQTGSWTKDYYVTAVAVHLTNMDLENETAVSHSIIESHVNNSNVAGAKATWKMILKLYNDAKTADGTNTNGEITTPTYKLTSAENTNSWTQQSDGTWHSSKFTVTLSDAYATSKRTGKVVDDATGNTVSGVSLVYNTEDLGSNFYIKATDAAYKDVGKNNITLRVTSTVTTHSLVGKSFKPAVTTKQPVIAMMFGETTKEKEVVAYATSRYTPPEGTVTVIKKDADTGAILPGAEFTLYKKENTVFKEVGKLVFDGMESVYMKKDLEPGTYKVTETKAPSQYIIETTPWSKEFTVSDDISVVNDFTYTVTNRKANSKISISKLANKTTGVTLVDGRYQGTKEPGWYDFGEQVTYKMIVKNTGNVAVKNLKIVDTMSNELKLAVDEINAQFVIPAGVKTDKGNAVTITKQSNTNLLIDKLAVGDSVTCSFAVTIKEKDIPVLLLHC